MYKESSIGLTKFSLYNSSITNIPTYGSRLALKLNNTFRLYYENINSFSIDKKSWKFSYKYKYLKYLWRILDIDIISIVETQVNPLLLDSSYNLPETLFQSDSFTANLTNNERELIRRK